MRLPSEDRDLSPLTGWTRAHWEAVADHLLTSVEPYATDGFAQYRLPGPASRAGVVSDGLEGFARTFLLAAFRIAGANGSAPGALLDRYAEGLIAGTDSGHRYAWPALTDMSQPIVEAASIAIALHETRPWLYDRLAPDRQERIVDWLAGIIGKRTPDSNWVLFRVIVEQFLASVGGPHEPAEIHGGLQRIEDWYTGDGWYSDGPGQNFDYYTGWALHLYPVLWARMADRTGPYAARLSEFLDDYQHFFAADGSPVFQGRSLTYRFATVAPLWLGALVDATPLPPGRTRRIASGALRHFLERGAIDGRGLLTLGWHGPFRPMVQSYSGPASPYWASKAFLGLLLPPEHPVWTAPEEPAAIDTGDVTVALPGPGWLLSGTRADGVVRLINHGSDRAAKTPPDGPPDPLYTRFAYSTHTAPQFGETPPDIVERRHVERIARGTSRHGDALVQVVTTSVVDGTTEVRIHEVTAPAGHLVRVSGHALADTRPPTREVTATSAKVTRADGLGSSVTGLIGFTGAGVDDRTGADPFGPCSATPFLTARHPGGTRDYVFLVVLGADHVTG
ncbi:DUF2264 domain-containing protein [Actinoplanes sichuanensis]|uniref:DUF2264 domain-containing protein n=1 Tax=Actinoplanes sichuanensis TaxID=512349 RepID=A0ABW4APB9_9ACTN|nr:DUF2264 domain-containing protein [Actinoplanes sichuanensis]BEL06620.1 DUF2264 domain-containing protein [Actinoplanes sichuanensis]